MPQQPRLCASKVCGDREGRVGDTHLHANAKQTDHGDLEGNETVQAPCNWPCSQRCMQSVRACAKEAGMRRGPATALSRGTGACAGNRYCTQWLTTPLTGSDGVRLWCVIWMPILAPGAPGPCKLHAVRAMVGLPFSKLGACVVCGERDCVI